MTLHPATSLVVLICALVGIYGISSPVVPVALTLTVAVVAGVSPRIRVRHWLCTTAVLALPMMVMALLIQGLFYPGEGATSLWDFGFASVTVEGLAVALGLGLRVLALVSIVVFFSLGADPTAVFDGFITLRAPLSVAYICATAMTLGPLLVQQWRTLWLARRARGWDTGAFSVRLRLFPQVITGLITSVLGQLDQRHQALLQRGFGTTSRPAGARSYTSGFTQNGLRWALLVTTALAVVLTATGVFTLPRMSDITSLIVSAL